MSEPTLQPWPFRLLGSTGGKIVALLAGGDRTVSELGEALGLTPNAVRVQLTRLERDGLIEQAGRREGVRKPHLLYRLSPQADQLFPKAYAPVLHHLLTTIAQRDPREMKRLMEEVGRRIAAGRPVPDRPEQRIAFAMSLLTELGAVAELQHDDQDRLVIQGRRCPLSDVVGEHPELCVALEQLIAELLGQPVRECCDRTRSAPACRFIVGAD